MVQPSEQALHHNPEEIVSGNYLIVDSSEGALEMGIVELPSGSLLCSYQGAESTSTVEDLEEGVEKLVAEVGSKLSTLLSGIIVSRGPGSFTGLRIGYSFVVGLAKGLKIKIIEIPSLDLYASAGDGGWGVALTDARRGEFFCRFFAWSDGHLIGRGFSGDSDVEILSPRGVLDGLLSFSNLKVVSDLFSNISPNIIIPNNQFGNVEEILGEVSAKFNLSSQNFISVTSRVGAIARLFKIMNKASSVYPLKAIEDIAPLYIRAIAAKTIQERAS
jgi:tRNA threonylcarbamoyl adenosine modification protein YeaZ